MTPISFACSKRSNPIVVEDLDISPGVVSVLRRDPYLSVGIFSRLTDGEACVPVASD